VPNLPITTFSTSSTSSSFSVLLFKAECHQAKTFKAQECEFQQKHYPSPTHGRHIPAKKGLSSTNSGGGLVSSTSIYFYRTYYTCRQRNNIAPKPQLSLKIPSTHHYQNNKKLQHQLQKPCQNILTRPAKTKRMWYPSWYSINIYSRQKIPDKKKPCKKKTHPLNSLDFFM
jgi:hypothetical protein